MPSKFRLRKSFAPVVKKIAQILGEKGMAPNQATWTMLSFAILSLISILFHNLLFFGIFVFITGIFDGVDGAIAREFKRGSKFGAFFDSTMDRVSEAVIYVGLFFNLDFFPLSEKWMITIIFLLSMFSFLISYSRARLELVGIQENTKFDSNIGLLGRSERLFFLFLISVFGFFYLPLFGNGFLLFFICVMGTAIFRIMKYRAYLDN